jgi:hypothetical protein
MYTPLPKDSTPYPPGPMGKPVVVAGRGRKTEFISSSTEDWAERDENKSAEVKRENKVFIENLWGFWVLMYDEAGK